MRGYDYLEFLGHKSFYANAELRFPLIEAMLTPIGVLGGIRGTFFFNFGVAGIAGQPMRAWTTDPVTVRPVVDYVGDPDTQSVRAVFGDPVNGLRLPARQRARLVRHRPHDLRHRLPDPLRLVVADAVQPGVGGPGVRVRRHAARGGARQRRVPARPLPDVDRLRLLVTASGGGARGRRAVASRERPPVAPHRVGRGSCGPRSR